MTLKSTLTHRFDTRGQSHELGRFAKRRAGWMVIGLLIGAIFASAEEIHDAAKAGDTPLHVVIYSGKDDVSRLLIGKGCDLHKLNTIGRTPLHHAARYNRPAVAAALLERGVAVDSRDQIQRIPLLLLTLMTTNVDAVRLLVQKGATSANEGTVKDMDGNVYRTVKIGNQVWMAENLKTTQFNDGTPIAYIPGSAQWRASMPPAYCWVDNDSSNRNKYGAMYNWYAVNTGKLAPVGWRVPSEEDFKVLIDYLGGESKAGDSLNNYGFTAQGAGQFVLPEIIFNLVTKLDKYWTTTTGGHHPADAKYLALTTRNGVGFSSQQKFSGKSVRCVKIN